MPSGSSLYSKYLKEIADKDMLETEKGFVIYQINKDNSCYIQDIYVLPEYRESKAASQLADQVSEIAKEKGCTKLIGTVIPTGVNSTKSIKVLLGYGFTLNSSTNNFIVFSKDLI